MCMRISKSVLSILVLLLIVFSESNAQEQLGLKIENYSGINSVLLNPTYQLTSPMKWSFNLASAGIFFDNNYGYLQNTSAINALRRRNEIKSRPDINTETENPDDFLILDYYNGNNKKQGSLLATVMGPSFMLNLNSGWSIGLYTNYRVASSARKIPSSLNYYEFENKEIGDEFEVAPFKVAGMSWGELGFNVAKKMQTNIGTIGIGINLKILNGNDGFFFNNNNTFQLSKLSIDSLDFESLDVNYGYTESLDPEDNYVRQRSGTGLGVDIGFSYIEEYRDGTYQWKAGAALVDIGRVNFNQNAPQFSINSDNAFTFATETFDRLSTIDDRSDFLSLSALNNESSAKTDDNFKIWLPAALTAFVDYRLTKSVYLNAVLVQSIPLGKNAVARDNLLAFTPRYEKKWFGAMMPISLYNYRKVRVGFAARLAFLTIGTEDLLSFVKQDEFTGSDLYVGVRVNPFNLGLGNGERGDNHRSKGCYW
jgi:hypothetical protein